MTDQPVASGGRRLRIVLHGQHLSGVGHYVRTYEIARALAAAHDVHLVEGGRHVPRPPAQESFDRIELPPIVRDAAAVRSLDGQDAIQAVLQRRADLLGEAIRNLRPDVLLIEHFPFSKWDLGAEILAAVTAARAARPGARVFSSVRDVLRQTRFEAVTPDCYRQRVVEWVNAHFDAILVHGDPALTTLEEHFDGVNELRVPVHYTGIVSEKVQSATGRDAGNVGPGIQGPYVLVSAGGGTGDKSFVDSCVEAWIRMHRNRLTGGRKMVIFAGLNWGPDRVQSLQSHGAGSDILVRPFDTEFLAWIAAADLAITHAGYNTCANILETRARALLLPDPAMSDQLFRAQRLAARGYAEILPAGISSEDLADRIRSAWIRPRREDQVNLDGAATTRRIIETQFV